MMVRNKIGKFTMYKKTENGRDFVFQGDTEKECKDAHYILNLVPLVEPRVWLSEVEISGFEHLEIDKEARINILKTTDIKVFRHLIIYFSKERPNTKRYQLVLDKLTFEDFVQQKNVQEYKKYMEEL